MVDSRDVIIELLKDKFQYEVERKKSQDDALSLPATLLSLLVAGAYVLITSIKQDDLKPCFYITEWIIVAGLCITCSVTIYFLFRSYFGYKRVFTSMPDSNNIVNVDYKNLKEYYADSVNNETREKEIINTLKDYTITWYQKCNVENAEALDNRSRYLFFAKYWIGISLIIGILLLIFTAITNTEMSKKNTPPPPPPSDVRRERSMPTQNPPPKIIKK